MKETMESRSKSKQHKGGFKDFQSWSKQVREDDRLVYPLKEASYAHTKVNLFFRDVHKDMASLNAGGEGPRALQLFFKWLGNSAMANDEATAWLLWTFSALKFFSEHQVSGILLISSDDKALKRLNNLVKASGVGSSLAKAILVELTCLRGRGVQPLDYDDEWSGRVDRAYFLKHKAAVIDPAKLRKAVRQVFNEEMGILKPWTTKERYWDKRWVYTKAGGHQKRIEEMAFGRKITHGKEVTRRVFAESVDECFLGKTEAKTCAGLSEKLEQGKTRAVYGCDSVSYYNFDYILRNVERSWRNEHVLLNPAKDSASELYSSLAKHYGSLYVMLDYDDFNSQHTTEAKLIVWEELRPWCLAAGVDPSVFDWCYKSISNEWVFTQDHPDGARTVGTLFSGHRGTTFFNSILNRAYILAVCGHLNVNVAKHSGDDVILIFNGAEDAANVLYKIQSSPLRMNSAKQGLGYYSGDFLRMAFDSKGAVGYLARSLATLVSGSWVTDAPLGSVEYITNLLGQSWTCANRSGNDNFGLLLVSSWKRRVPVLSLYAVELLTHRTSLNRSPIRGYVNEFQNIVLRTSAVSSKYELKGAADHATTAYLNKCTNISLLKLAGVTPGQMRGLMLEASYKPIIPRSVKILGVEKYTAGVVTTVYGENLPRYQPGRLETMMPLAYLRGRLTDTQLQRICEALQKPQGEDIVQWAWGHVGYNVDFQQRVMWSEAQAMSRRVGNNAHVMLSFSVRG